jgi:hypothetical protein
MQTATTIPHTQRSFAEEKEYFDTKTIMYMHLHFAVCDVARQVLEKKAASLADKEKIAQGVVESQTLPCGMTMTIETSEEEWDDEIEQRVDVILEYKGWFASLGVKYVDSGELTKASIFYSDYADCDIRIDWDDGQPRFEYVENPYHPETVYDDDPHKEQWIIDGMDDHQQTFKVYAEDFGIVDENECLEELVQICLDVLENQNFDDEDEIDEFIVDLLNCCACEDVRPDGYEFGVEKGHER